MITTLIADDEKPALDRLKDLLEDHPQFEIVAEATDGSKALEKIVAHQPEVAFLDINMPGVSVFNTITSLQKPPLIIFQTAHSEHAAVAFDIDAVDYLLKPISRERFTQAVFKIQERLSPPASHSPKTEAAEPEPSTKSEAPSSVPQTGSEQEAVGKISIRAHGAIKIVALSDIRKICFEEGLSFVYAAEGRFMADRTLNDYEEKLKYAGFFRCNRANLINLEHVVAVHKGFKGNYDIELVDGSRIDCSRRKVPLLKKKLDF